MTNFWFGQGNYFFLIGPGFLLTLAGPRKGYPRIVDFVFDFNRGYIKKSYRTIKVWGGWFSKMLPAKACIVVRVFMHSS